MNYEALGFAPSNSKVRLYTDRMGIANDLVRFLYGKAVKGDHLNESVTLDFSLTPIPGANLDDIRPHRGDYIRFETGTYGLWYTGRVTNEPELEFIGRDPETKLPVWTYNYQATSDEYALNQLSLELMNPFLNTTQGAIIKALVNTLAPGRYDTTGIQDAMRVSRYVIDPKKKFGDVVKELADMSNSRFYAKDNQLFYEPQDFRPAALVIDGNDPYFTPSNLSIKAADTTQVINDAVVLGDIEPQGFMNEYFLGDGIEGTFPLVTSPYGVDSFVLVDETFTGTGIDDSKWTLFDTVNNYLQVSNGYLNILGGNQANSFDAWIQTAQVIPLEGDLRLLHGEWDFLQGQLQTLGGVIGGLWTSNPTAGVNGQNIDTLYPGCLYGLRVWNGSVLSQVFIQPVVNGVVDTTQSFIFDLSKRYVIRTLVHFNNLFRATQQYSFVSDSGTVGNVGGSGIADNVSFMTIVTEIDPLTGAVTKQRQFVSNCPLTSEQLFAVYVPAAANDLHATVTNITISNPLQAFLEIKSKATGLWQQEIIGPNEIDAQDGETPIATITTTGTTTKNSLLGTQSYNPGDATLKFFKDTSQQQMFTAGPGDIIHLRYRRAGVALARVQDKQSIANEAQAWGDKGIRSITSSDLNPPPRTSEECELAASALVQDNSYQHYDGTYITYNVFGLTDEPVSGTILKFLNLPIGVFPNPQQLPIPPVDTGDTDENGNEIIDPGDPNTHNFTEQIQEVKTTLHFAKGDTELFEHEVTFGRPDVMKQFVAKFQKPADLFTPDQQAQIPDGIDTSTIGQSNVPSVVAPSFTGIDPNFTYYDAGQDPPVDGGFEVRYDDSAWGVDDGKNLITRITGRTWGVGRTARSRISFVRAFDRRNRCLWSEDLTFAVWQKVNTTVSLSVDTDPDGERGVICELRMPGSESVWQEIATQTSGTQSVFTVNLKGPSGVSMRLQLEDSTTGRIVSSKDWLLNGVWQRVDVSGLGDDLNTGNLVVRIINLSGVTQIINATRASVELGRTIETVYCKTKDQPHGAYSRFAAGLHAQFPLKPHAPTGTLDCSNITAPVVTLNTPDIMDDVWGIEITAPQANKVSIGPQGRPITILGGGVDAVLHEDLTADNYTNTFTRTGNTTREQLYTLYTYNLMGEYSDPYVIEFNIPLPQVINVHVNEPDRTLRWNSVGALGAYIQIFTDANYTQLLHTYSVTAQMYALPDDSFFPLRYIAVTPYDALGNGIAVRLSHEYVPNGLNGFDVEQVQPAVAPPTPRTDPTPPPPMRVTITPPRPNLWRDEGYHNYTFNKRAMYNLE